MQKILGGLFLFCFALTPVAAQQQGFDKSKPLDLRFYALGGKEVNLANMRGKVVLLDFWSSADQASRQNEFKVYSAYKKYHDQGFRVLGISWDTDKTSLLTLVQNYGIYWPQYFDGLGSQNAISARLGVTSIPTLWLINQKGIVVNTNVSGDDLSDDVKKLLKAP
jgi:peroxiredoxin